MSFRNKLWATFMWAVCALPVVLEIATVGRHESTMITDSVPDHSIFLMVFFGLFFATVTAVNFRLLFLRGKDGKWLQCFWVVLASWFVIDCPQYYSFLYQQHLFATGASFDSRTVKIDRVYSADTRSGTDYYGSVNPYSISNFHPRVRIDRDLFFFASKLAASDAKKPPGSRSAGCLIHVVVHKVGTAERIEWQHGYIDQSAIASCG